MKHDLTKLTDSDIAEITKQADYLLTYFPSLADGIQSEEEHANILALLDKLILTTNTDSPIFRLLFGVVERYEDTAPQFSDL